MNKQLLKDAVGWGLILWFIGYVLGFIFFAFVPQALIGWVIMPIGILVTVWVLARKIHSSSLGYYAGIALVWTVIAIVLDYLFIGMLLHPADGYYKIDVYLYYCLTLLLPLVVGWQRSRDKSTQL